MNNAELSFNEGQFKRLGMKEAFTPELIARMMKGEQSIAHPYSKNIDGDKADLNIYLKKSATSDYYFINKYDLNLQQAGQEKAIKQTFFISNKKKEGTSERSEQRENDDFRYTLKRAYNFLSGRPVYNSDTQSWEKINKNVKLANGNHATTRFDKSYGYDLEKVLSHYSITELGNKQYKDSLIDSLQRGNLQKAHFKTAEGKTEEFYVSPSIKTGSLKIYDKDRKEVPLETQVAKQLISKDLTESLKQIYANKQKADQSQKPPDEKQEGLTQGKSHKEVPKQKVA